MNVAAYVRMSTEHQKYSITNQLAAIEAYCRSRSMELTRIYSDAGRSGLTASKRPGLTSLIDDARNGSLPFSAVIVLDVSRWGRFQNVDEGAYYEHVLRRAGVRMIYCAEPFENDDSPAMTIIKSVKRAMAAEYSRELSRKVTAGSRRVAMMGFRCGGAAGYGFRRAILGEDGAIIQVAERGEWKALRHGHTALRLGPAAEVKAVRRIYRLYVIGRMTLKAIAKQMEAEGWPRPAPAGWTRQQITNILSNEKYAGTGLYGITTQYLSSKRIPTDASTWIRREDAHPAIISRRTFLAAAARRRRVRRLYSPEEIIKVFRAIQAEHGTVTRSLIQAHPDLPCPGSVRNCFGTLENAYLAAGLPAQTMGERRAIRSAALRSARQVYSDGSLW